MPQIKYRHPLLEWDEYNQDPDLAFTLVALNERARQMWAEPHNSSRYVPPSLTRATSIKEDEELENEDKQTRPKEEKDREPALQFLFSKQPKDFAKGFVLGSDGMICDALLGDPGSRMSPQALAFTFNKKHQLVMHATSANIVAVTFNDQKKAERTQFSWILPRGQREIRVEMANKLQFEVVLPRYGTRKYEFHQNCNKYISYVARGEVPTHGLVNNSEAVTRPESGTSKSWEPSSFYLRGRKIGNGTYGDVETVLRMPDGKIFAAKRFKSRKSFRKEVRMLQKVCETPHPNIVQFVEAWHGDYEPVLIMEYVGGGTLRERMVTQMTSDEIVNLAIQMLTALDFLHDQGVMHRDIKPANILCVTPDHYRLADFGVAREIAPLVSKQGTSVYMAPEVRVLAQYSSPADMWSLGVVIAECYDDLPGGNPELEGREWCDRVGRRFARYSQRREKQQDWNTSVDHDLIRCVRSGMIRSDPEKRWSARKCLESLDLAGLGSTERSDAGSGANTPTQEHPKGSIPPVSTELSEVDNPLAYLDGSFPPPSRDPSGGGESETSSSESLPPASAESPESQNSEDVTWEDALPDGGMLPTKSKKPPSFRKGRLIVEILDDGEPSLQGNALPPLPSIIEGTSADPGVDQPSSDGDGAVHDPERAEADTLLVIDDEGTPEASISDGKAKRKRGDQSSGQQTDGSTIRANSAKLDIKRNKLDAPTAGFLDIRWNPVNGSQSGNAAGQPADEA